MDELKGLIRDLDADTKALRRSQEKETETRKADTAAREKSDRRRNLLLTALILVVVAACLVIVRVVVVYSCSTDRTKALTGPATDRVNLFLQAYTEAAGQIHHPLTDPEKKTVIDGLIHDRKTFTVLPDRAKLEKATDFALLGYRDLIASLRANKAYNQALEDHPVCSFWGL